MKSTILSGKMDAIKAGVYQIKCIPTGFVYIGSSSNIERRLRQHFKNLNEGKHDNYKLQAAYNEYKPEDFETCALETAPAKTLRYLLYKMEQKWLDCTENKYNILTSATAHLKTKTVNKLRKQAGLEPEPPKVKKAKRKKVKKTATSTPAIQQSKRSLKVFKKVAAKKKRREEFKAKEASPSDILQRKLAREARKAQTLANLFA